MNMKKVLAAGVAATLAVTSLTAVTGAEDLNVDDSRTFDMITSYGHVVFNPAIVGVEGIDPGDYYDFNTGKNFGLAGAVESDQNTNGDSDINWNPIVNELDFDYYVPFRVQADDAGLLSTLGTLSVTIKGKKLASDGATTVDLTQTAKLLRVDSATNSTVAAASVNYVLPIYVNGGPLSNAFVPERFVQIDEISFTATATGSVGFYGLDEDDYTTLITAATSGSWDAAIAYNIAGDEISPLADTDNDGVEDEAINTWVYKYDINGYRAARIYIALADPFVDDANGNNDNGSIAYTVDGAADADGDGLLELTGTAVALADIADGDGVDFTSGTEDGGFLISAIESMLKPGVFIVFKLDSSACEVYDIEAWLPYTDRSGVIGTYDASANLWSGGLLERNDIWRLSDTDDYNSAEVLGRDAWNNQYTNIGGENVSDNQSYKVVDYNKGTVPRGFSGLASQVADFFNLKDYGEIEFVFASYVPTAAVSTWKHGGVPSTEVGLRNFIEEAQVKDFALFFNYNATTGSLQTNASIDVATGSVKFSMNDILTQLGGYTKATIQDVYYGLGRGVAYSAYKGLDGGTIGIYVSKINFTAGKNKDTTVSGDTATKDDEKEEEVKEDNKGDVVEQPTDDDNTEVEIPDDDDSTIEIPDDDDGSDVVVAPDDDATTPVVVNPSDNTPAPGADENPHTGVALAVVPMIAAAAAMVISKKRK